MILIIGILNASSHSWVLLSIGVTFRLKYTTKNMMVVLAVIPFFSPPFQKVGEIMNANNKGGLWHNGRNRIW